MSAGKEMFAYPVPLHHNCRFMSQKIHCVSGTLIGLSNLWTGRFVVEFGEHLIGRFWYSESWDSTGSGVVD